MIALPLVELREAHELGQAFVEPRRVLAGELRRQVEVRVLVEDDAAVASAASRVAVHHHVVGEGARWNQPATFCRGCSYFFQSVALTITMCVGMPFLLGALAERLLERDAELREVLDELARLARRCAR